jgi:hypothetical protein
VRTFTLHLDPATDCFDDDALERFTEQYQVLSVDERFFIHEERPCLALVVCYQDLAAANDAGQEAAGRQRRSAQIEHRPPFFVLFDALNAWRKERAQREGRAPRTLLFSRQMSAIAAQRPTTLEELRLLPDIGEAKAEEIGAEVIPLVRQVLEQMQLRSTAAEKNVHRKERVPGTSTRDRERLAQGAGAVFSPRRAAELLPGDDTQARRWLREQALIHALNDKEVVVWQEVLDRLRGQPDGPAAGVAPRGISSGREPLPRTDLSGRKRR